MESKLVKYFNFFNENWPWDKEMQVWIELSQTFKTKTKKIKEKIDDNPTILVKILMNDTISVEAEDRVHRLLKLLDKKLGIQIFADTLEDKYNWLMRQLDSVNEDNYKKHIFYWVLYYILKNDLDIKKANKFIEQGFKQLENKRYHQVIQNYKRKEKMTKKEAIEKVKNDGLYLENLTKEQKADKEIVLVAIQANAYAIQYASDELKNDKEVIIEAVKQSPELLKYASRDLRADKEIVYKFITL